MAAVSDLDQAIDRLSHAVRTQEDRKVVFLTGSGISAPNVPGTQEMVTILLDELGAKPASDLRASFGVLSDSDQYLAAAHELQRRRGDIGLAAAISKGVRRALNSSYTGSGTDLELIPDSAWNVPDAQRLLGELFAEIPPQQAGAVITTNFDPLTEVSFRRNNVAATPLAVPGAMAFPIDAICGPLPIVHLHGFWEKTATLSTAVQLETQRPQIERMITRLLDKAILVVMGYGGWNDSFTRALSQMIIEGHTTSLQTEIMWLQYGKQEGIASHPLLRSIQGQAGVSIYSEIPAVDFLEGVIKELSALNRPPKKSPLGWMPPASAATSPTTEDLRKYVEGAQPNWHTSGEMPMLRNALHAYEAVRTACADATSRLLVITGPAGEGKTTALLQVATKIAENLPDANVLYRNPGAPRVTSDWVNQIASENDLSVLFVDDADLIADQVHHATLNRDEAIKGQIIWVLALHTSYVRSGKIAPKLAAAHARTVEFEPFSADDAKELAAAWQRHRLLPEEYEAYPNQAIADIVSEAGASTSQGRSLFGSILHLWGSDDLEDRVGHMLTNVSRLSIAGVSFKQLLGSVALTQVAWDPEAENGEGLSVAALGALAKTTNHDIVRLVVEPLGREVGISQVGDRVYMRHPSIAKAVVDILRDRGELEGVAQNISHRGSLMRYSNAYYRPDFNSAYMLSRKLQGPEALAASLGAVHGAPRRLEPRVTAIATLRENGELKKAQKYAVTLAGSLEKYDDQLQTQRGFFVEWSVVESRLGNNQRALEMAIRAVSDQIPGFLSLDKLEYGLVNIAGASDKLAYAGVAGASVLRVATGKVLNRLPAGQIKFRHLAEVEDTSSLFEIGRDFRTAAEHFAPHGTTFRKMTSALRVNVK
jgi:hypothetical protein